MLPQAMHPKPLPEEQGPGMLRVHVGGCMGGKVHAYVVLFVRVHARMQARICVCMCTGVVAVTAQHFFLHKSLYIIKDAKGSDIHATGHLSVCVLCVCFHMQARGAGHGH